LPIDHHILQIDPINTEQPLLNLAPSLLFVCLPIPSNAPKKTANALADTSKSAAHAADHITLSELPYTFT
jgi:hypothetical protein